MSWQISRSKYICLVRLEQTNNSGLQTVAEIEAPFLPDTRTQRVPVHLQIAAVYVCINSYVFTIKVSRKHSHFTCVAGMHFHSTSLVATVQTIYMHIIVEATVQFRTIIKQCTKRYYTTGN
jgi:hypothetical protein